MSSSRPTRSSQRTPASVGSKGKKKARTTEEPTPTPEDYIYSSSLNSMVNAPDAGKKFFDAMGGEVREPPKASKEYNQKTLRLMGFTQNDEASFGEIKEEQKKLGQQLEKLSLDMKTGFDDIKQLFAAHDERFNLLDKDVRLLKHQVNNSIHVASEVIQATVNDLKSSAQDVVNATELSLDVDRNLRPLVMKWTYWFSTTWSNWLKKFDVDHPPPP
ncbi:hypothetical protein CJ030_MR5G010039 [Morella rubra]|uniref:Uncharacterized protein n=1 Tax=Morella rubra TaxID=262757 RepID=A0A6A1VG24_9ROSI|nr:hypothetical protein CJ030_MR5G010039 [Morella rubra]